MIKEKTEQTVETVRESLEKIGFVNHAQKLNIVDELTRNEYIEKREIGYVDRRKMCYV